MFETRAEAAGWLIAIVGVCIMGFMAFHGPFHLVKPTAAETSSFAPVHVKILNDHQTVGRYQPSNITVHLGQTVVFTNMSSVDHTATAKDDSFNSGNIAIGASYSFAPSKVGQFPVICSYHPLMKAVLNVLR